MTPTFRIEQIVGVIIVALLTVGAFIILQPFLPGLLYAVILAVSTWPVFKWLEHRLGGRTSLAAGLMTLFFAALLIVPLVLLSMQLAEEVPRIADGMKEMLDNGFPAAPEWVSRIPYVGEALEHRWNDLSTDTRKLAEMVRPYLAKSAEFALGLGAHIGNTIMQLLVSLLISFFLFRDGTPLVTHVRAMARRVGDARGERLLNVAGATMRSVVYGILGAAVIQALLATFGFWLAGLKGWAFLGLVAGLLALIPIGLIMLVMFGATAWLFYLGSTGWGIFLLLWSILVVGQVDNFIRPVIISRGANLPIIVVLLGILGGLAVAGILGLFVGATVVGVVYTMLRDWVDEPVASVTAQSPDPRSGS
jgi:predicted PurR-regulated permease PerM